MKTKLTPLQRRAFVLLIEHCEKWGHAIADDIADHQHDYLTKRQASRALVQLSVSGHAVRKRGKFGSWRGSIYKPAETGEETL